MKIVIASGKGGVGKSMLTSSLALFFSKENKIVVCDCDVDAPNLGLWLGVNKYEKTEKISVSQKAYVKNKALVDKKCIKICPFNAIQKTKNGYIVNKFLCEGCGACTVLCKKGAFELKPVINGEILITKTKYGFYLISGKLYPGETSSGKIVDKLKEKLNNFDYELALIDSAAGIGCPVNASLRGSDFAILVTEPTLSAFHDLKRVLEVVNYFKIQFGVVINKWDINKEMSSKIEKWAGEKFLGKIPYDKNVINAIVNLRPAIEMSSLVRENINNIFMKIREIIQ